PLLRRRALSRAGRRRAGLRVPRLRARDLLRRAALRARHHRRVSRPDALPHDGTSDLRDPERRTRARLIVSDRPACEYLAWDSDFFGLRIARAVAPLGPDSIGDVRAWCTAEKIDGVYALLPCADRTGIATAEASGFGLVDVRVTLVADRGATAVTDRPDIRPARDGDRASLRAIARASH